MREFDKEVLAKVQFDNNYLVCCDCKDDCRNSEQCACQRLTIESSSSVHEFDEFPIKNRILKHKILTGIYECNAGCACQRKQEQCVNRNVQLGLRNKLQLFKTKDKGWGVRTLHDLPKGSFICSYSGVILDDAKAEKEGQENGDTYLADLDLIESVEGAKREQYDLPAFNLDENCGDSNFENGSFRRFYKESFGYAINGGKKGNIGRFLNHSCDPNCFAQNVFVDSHDLRFPWLAFYSLRHIPANSEITWDYNYAVGCLPSKHIACYCNSDNCRKRLL